MPGSIKDPYFTNYCGAGHYDDNYLDYSGIEHCIEIIDRLKLKIESVAVLGTATGRVLQHFDSAWGVRAEGCEISRWAHRRIPKRYRNNIACTDLRRYVPRLLKDGRRIDLCFSNSLVYLAPDEVEGLLKQCARIFTYFHFLSSTSESYEPADINRVTLRPRAWWRRRFIRAGFQPTRSPYLFRAHTMGTSECYARLSLSSVISAGTPKRIGGPQ